MVRIPIQEQVEIVKNFSLRIKCCGSFELKIFMKIGSKSHIYPLFNTNRYRRMMMIVDYLNFLTELKNKYPNFTEYVIIVTPKSRPGH